MAVYVIGDLQGCYSQLCRLLDSIKFDPRQDRLWFCGDLVNRGPESLETLRFVKSLGEAAITVLGNHDLHLLALYHGGQVRAESDALAQVLKAPDCAELMAWLQSLRLAHYDETLNVLLVHAGIHEKWNLQQVLGCANELERVLHGSDSGSFFEHMYGDEPGYWSDDLEGMERFRLITNIFTRLRFYSRGGRLELEAKGAPQQHAQHDLIPWFERENRLESSVRVVFGHWSTLPVGVYGRYYAIDAGCIWGGRMVALRIDTVLPQWHSIDCQT